MSKTHGSLKVNLITKLAAHAGHNVSISTSGNDGGTNFDVVLECKDCGCAILSASQYDHILKAFKSYVSNDLEAADMDYVLDALDQAGVGPEERKDLFPEIADAEDEVEHAADRLAELDDVLDGLVQSGIVPDRKALFPEIAAEEEGGK